MPRSGRGGWPGLQSPVLLLVSSHSDLLLCVQGGDELGQGRAGGQEYKILKLLNNGLFHPQFCKDNGGRLAELSLHQDSRIDHYLQGLGIRKKIFWIGMKGHYHNQGDRLRMWKWTECGTELSMGDRRWWSYFREPSGNGHCVWKAIDMKLDSYQRGLGHGYADYNCDHDRWPWPQAGWTYHFYALCETTNTGLANHHHGEYSYLGCIQN